MEEKELQKKYIEYQVVTERIKQLQQQMQTVEQQMVDMLATIQSIDEFSLLADSSEVLVPINNGIFAKAKLKKEDKLLINVGASVVIDKTPEQTKELIERQKMQLEEIRKKIIDMLKKLVDKASALEHELNEMLS